MRSVVGARIDDFHPDVVGVSVRNIDNQSMKNPLFLLAPVKNIVDECRSLSRAPIVVGAAVFPYSR